MTSSKANKNIYSNRLKIYEDKLKDIKEDFKKLKTTKFKNTKEKIRYLKGIKKKCNIFEDINRSYLCAVQENIKDSKDKEKLKKKLKKYEPSISKKCFNQYFHNSIDKVPPNIKFKKLFERLVLIGKNIDSKGALDYLTDLLVDYKETHFYSLNFQLLQEDNRELYLNKLYNIAFLKIVTFIDELKDNDTDNYNDKDKKEYTSLVQLCEEKKNNYKNTMSEQAEKEAKFYIQKINAFKMLQNKNIKTFFKKFVMFFKSIYKELNSRFPDYNIKDEKDIKLFENFLFFIGNYDFIKYDTIYKEIWKE